MKILIIMDPGTVNAKCVVDASCYNEDQNDLLEANMEQATKVGYVCAVMNPTPPDEVKDYIEE